MQLKLVISTVFAVEYTVMSGSGFCYWSNETVESVQSCPRTKSEIEKRARLKNCTSLAFIQNCTKTIKFKYHCVINELEDAFLEVCAPEYYIHGACTEYNTHGGVIQPHYHLKCSDVEPPCPERYLSTDAYLYEGCYNAVKTYKDWTLQSTGLLQTSTSKSAQTNKTKILEKITICLISVVVSSVVIMLLIKISAKSICRSPSANICNNIRKCILVSESKIPLGQQPTDNNIQQQPLKDDGI